MKFFFIILLISFRLFANDGDAIYATKKEDILRQFEKIDEARQELEAYRAATKSIFDKRESEILKKQKDLNQTIQIISQKEQNIKNMLDKNEKILKELKNITSDKVLQVYQNMKDEPAATIISGLDRKEAAKILYALPPKKISSILSKMDAAVAGELTEILRNGNIFSDENKTKP